MALKSSQLTPGQPLQDRTRDTYYYTKNKNNKDQLWGNIHQTQENGQKKMTEKSEDQTNLQNKKAKPFFFMPFICTILHILKK